MDGILEAIFTNIDFEIYDGEVATKENMLYDSKTNHKYIKLSKETTITINQHTWTLLFRTNSVLESENIYIIFLIPSLVLILTLLLFLLIKTKEIEQQHTKALFSAMAYNATDAIIILENDGKIGFWNHAAERMFGYSEQEAIGAAMERLIIPKGLREKHAQGFKKFSLYGKGDILGKTIIFPALRKDGSEFYTEHSISAINYNGKWQALGVIRDITERKAAEKISSRMGSLLAHSWNEVCIFDANSLRFIDVSARAQENLGYTLEEFKKMTPMDICEDLSLENFKSMLKPLQSKEEEEISFEAEHRRKDGSSYPVEVRLQLLAKEYPPVYMAITQDISERKKYIEDLQYKALYDELTGLPNRYALLEDLEKQCEIAKENRTQVAVYSIKTLKFNEINDILGYDSGNKILQEIAIRLKDSLAENTLVARSGDNIFSLVVSDMDNEPIISFSEQIKTLLQEPLNYSEIDIEVEFCIGLALYPQHADDAQQLLKNADNAMQSAKKEGVIFNLYIPEDAAANLQKMKHHGELRAAIENRELVLYYQPQVDIKSGRIVSVEALARWPHKKYGMVYPSIFIPIIEQSTLIYPFTKWVLEEAVLQLSRWRDEGIELSIAVNLSAKNLLDESLPNYIADLLRVHKVDVGKLSLEITESALMTRPDEAMKIITQLHEMGFRLSLDDFGTGYSSLSYLQKLPIHELKIDQSFIFGFLNNEDDAAIVRSTIDLANNLKLITVAEGVENREVYEMLATLNCSIAQGYYMAKPLSIENLTLWLRESPFGLGDLV